MPDDQGDGEPARHRESDKINELRILLTSCSLVSCRRTLSYFKVPPRELRPKSRTQNRLHRAKVAINLLTRVRSSASATMRSLYPTSAGRFPARRKADVAISCRMLMCMAIELCGLRVVGNHVFQSCRAIWSAVRQRRNFNVASKKTEIILMIRVQ